MCSRAHASGGIDRITLVGSGWSPTASDSRATRPSGSVTADGPNAQIERRWKTVVPEQCLLSTLCPAFCHPMFKQAWAGRSGLEAMLVLSAPESIKRGAFAERRATAIANANWFRALAWRALRDGQPRGELRAANARFAARIVLRQAKRDAQVNKLVMEALADDPERRRA